MKAYSAGVRSPSPENAQIIADALEARGQQQIELARRLRKAAE
jgi:hypothetical protein